MKHKMVLQFSTFVVNLPNDLVIRHFFWQKYRAGLEAASQSSAAMLSGKIEAFLVVGSLQISCEKKRKESLARLYVRAVFL
jgi:hypothetical protein